MDRVDLKLPPPGDLTLTTTASGDCSTTSGRDSLQLKMLRALSTVPGEMLHRPRFGIGAEDQLERPGPRAIEVLVSRTRRFLRGDRRVVAQKVTGAAEPGSPHIIGITALVRTTADTTESLTATVVL